MQVKLQNQGDPRWFSEEMAPGVKIGPEGCFLSCIAMALGNYAIDTDPGSLSTALKPLGGFDSEGNMNHNKLPLLYPQILDFRRVDTTNAPGGGGKTLPLTAIEDIKRLISIGMPVQVWVDNVGNDGKPDHWVLCKDYKNGDFLINNPDGGLEQWFSVRYGDITKKLYGYYAMIGPPIAFPDSSTQADHEDGQAAYAASQGTKVKDVASAIANAHLILDLIV